MFGDSDADGLAGEPGEPGVADWTVYSDANGNSALDPGEPTDVTEGGATDQISIVLTSEPTGNVVIDVSSGDTGEATVAPSQR